MERIAPPSRQAPAMSVRRAILLRQTKSFLRLGRYLRGILGSSYRFLAFRVNPFWIQLSYFLFLDFMGSLALMAIKPSNPSFKPRYVDMFYLSTSSLTVSGLATVEMEVLSQSHVVVYTLLMLLGGEVWVSLLGLIVRLPKLRGPTTVADGRVDPVNVELGSMDPQDGVPGFGHVVVMPERVTSTESKDMKHRCLRMLAYVVFLYHFLIHVSGSLFIFLYLSLVSSAKEVLKGKGIRILPFAISITVSSFANGGLIPTNENMIVFKKNAGLLLLMIPQILAGNTMFPVFLRLVVWTLRKLTRREEFQHMMESPKQVGFAHLMPNLQIVFLAVTIVGLLAIETILFCALEWKTDAMAGLNWFQKIIAASFQTSNARHAGEASFDLSSVSPAILVLFVVIMYLPAYTSFWPFKDGSPSSEKPNKEKKRTEAVDNMILSQLSYIVIFVIIVCLIERKKMVEDPVNFSVLNVVFEVMSAYGNVGLSLGYSCARQITRDASCKDAWYGFSGKFSAGGKLMITFIMLFGRLKKFHMGGGKAWKLE